MKKSAMEKPKRGRPIDQGMRDKIIAAAGDLFYQHGLHATTMEDIASALQISKLTLYSRFQDKGDLFSAVIRAKCQKYIPDHIFVELEEKSVEESLFSIAFSLLNLFTSSDAMGVERMLMGLEAAEREALVGVFYEAGPVRVKAMIAEHLNTLHAQRTLHIPDPIFSTNIFIAMMKGSDMCLRACMQMPQIANSKEMQAYCRQAVQVFIRAHMGESQA